MLGWVAKENMAEVWRSTDLLVVPSLWPEPFGFVGPEAGRYGVPAAAFAVGGIGEWLREAVNGHVAPANPPRAAGLADAVVRCLQSAGHHANLRRGAREQSLRYSSAGDHVEALLAVFEAARR
jgi:glycosyltransferase involved in cell wall biosynthesis